MSKKKDRRGGGKGGRTSATPERASVTEVKRPSQTSQAGTGSASPAASAPERSSAPPSEPNPGGTSNIRTTLRIGSGEGFSSVIPPPVTAADGGVVGTTVEAKSEAPTPAPAEPPGAEALRPASGEAERSTIPPDDAAKADEAKPEATAAVETDRPGAATRDSAEVLKAGGPSMKTTQPMGSGDEAKKLVESVTAAAKAEAATAAAKTDSVRPPAEEKSRAKDKDDLLVTRKDTGRREKKESLSTHLSDEARAFFSEAAFESAYKVRHDTFEDLKPAHEEHPHEATTSRRWMAITGLLLVGIVGVVVAFSLYNRFGVQETTIDTSTVRTTDPTPPPVTAEDAGQATANTGAGTDAGNPMAAVDTGATPVVVEATDAAPAAVADTGSAVVVTPVVDAGVPAVAVAVDAGSPAAPPAPTTQTPAELLAAARRTRGTPAARLAAWEAYFAAAPTDDRTMSDVATTLAEQGRNADAERVASRAVQANPQNGKAWFVLAYSRRQLRNVEGAREARTRCIAVGGQWAAECRAL